MNMVTLQYKNFFSWLAVALWMAVIFYLSHQPADQSSDLSSGITDPIIRAIQYFFPFIPLDTGLFHHLVRKSAHFIAYLLLGGLVMNALRFSGSKKVIIAIVVCVVYAASDEIHQLFIPGRSGEVRDVAIDGAGATTGVGLYLFGVYIVRRFPKKKQKNRSAG